MSAIKTDEAAHLRQQIELARQASSRIEPELAPALARLRRWQADRLARTYADLSADARYRLATRFFLDDLYGGVEPTGRDDDIERIYPLAVQALSAETLRSWALAMELDALSRRLDHELVRVMVGQLGMRDEVTEALYAEGYRRCDNYEARRHQIELVGRIGRILDEVVARPMIYTALRMARMPAQMAGFGVLQSFLERGFAAFRRMGGADRFIHTIVSRETRILDRIYAGHPRPFDLDAPDDAAAAAASGAASSRSPGRPGRP